MRRGKPWACRGGVLLLFRLKGYPYFLAKGVPLFFLAKGVNLFFWPKGYPYFLARGIIRTPSINRIPLINRTLSINQPPPYFLKKLEVQKVRVIVYNDL